VSDSGDVSIFAACSEELYSSSRNAVNNCNILESTASYWSCSSVWNCAEMNI